MSSCSTLILATTLSLFGELTAGKYYRIVREPAIYDAWRHKRQSHPQATQVRIPEVAFGGVSSGGGVVQAPPSGVGGPSLDAPPKDDPVTGLADYLTPPAPAADLTQNRQQGDRWDLRFDANEILVPPADQNRQYDTLRLFSLVPTSPEAANPPLDRGFEDVIQDILLQQDNAPAGSNRETNVRKQIGGQEYRPPPAEKGPVYTYVKTDKHGHFKWGVRHGH